jgi:hypothetical protein
MSTYEEMISAAMALPAGARISFRKGRKIPAKELSDFETKEAARVNLNRFLVFSRTRANLFDKKGGAI